MLVHATVVPPALLAILASMALAQDQGATRGATRGASQGATRETRKEPDPLELVGQAEALHKKGKAEEASTLLRQAAAALQTTPESVVRANLEKAIRDLLARADPVTARRQEAFRLAAAGFVELSESYGRRRWHRMALLALRRAERLHPATAAEPLARLRKKDAGAFAWEEARRRPRDVKPAAAQKPEPKDRISAFAGLKIPGWEVTPTEITSPVPPDDSSSPLLTKALEHGDGSISIEVRRSTTKGEASLLFGAKGYDDYFILSVHYYGSGRATVGLFHWGDNKLTQIGYSDFFRLSEKERLGWLRYGVRIQGRKATCFVGDTDRLTVDCPWEPRGRIGVAVARAATGRVRFRKLHVEELPVAGPDSGPEARPEPREKTPAERLMEKAARAERLMTSRRREQKEEAVLALVEAQRMARALPDDTAGRTVRASIRRLLGKADPLHGHAGKTLKAAAEAILAAANAYSGNGWHKTARRLLLQVRQLDREVAEPALEANRKSLEPILEKERGLPPEPQGPADNALLVRWFKGGREPWDADRAWKVDGKGAAAPTDRLGDAMIVSTQSLGEKAELSVQVKTTRQKCTAGVAFALKSINSYYVVLWTHSPEQDLTRMQLYRNKGRDFKRFGPTRTLRFSPEAREQWMTLRLKYGDGKVAIQLGEAPELALEPGDGHLAGRIGLFTHVDHTRQPVRFRNLVIGSKDSSSK